MWDKMDEEKKAKMTEMLKEMDIDEKIIDESLIWTVKKISFKLMKLRMVLDEKGVKEEETKKIIEKIVAKAMDKDLDEIKAWHKEHDDEKGHCC